MRVREYHVSAARVASAESERANSRSGLAYAGVHTPIDEPRPKPVVPDIVQKSGETRLYIVNADGSGRRVLDSIGGCAPVWSSDGSMIAYMQTNGMSGKVITIRPDGTGRIPGAPVAPGTSGRLTDDATANVTFTSTGSLLVQRILTRYLDANHVGSQILELRAPDGTRVATRVIKAADLSHSPALTARAG